MRLLRFLAQKVGPPLRFRIDRKTFFLPLFLFFAAGIDAPAPESGLSPEVPSSIGGRERQATPAGTIVPQPSTPETFSETPTPLVLRVVNRAAKSIFLQGVRQAEERVQLFFYHREAGKGWKPFFETLPCDLPTCRNLHAAKSDCNQAVPFAISLGPAGTSGSVKELKWDGLLYQRIEATQADLQRRYCYKGWVPKSGRIRGEIDFSETAQIGGDKGGTIGGRDHTALEFDLPPSRQVYEIEVGH